MTFEHTSHMGGPGLGTDSSGALNLTFNDAGADNFISVSIVEGTTVTSGYCQPFYANITMDSDAAWSTGNSQLNAFATDITMDGTVSCEVEGMYIYITSSSGTLTSANVSGVVVNMAEMPAPSTRAGIQLHFEGGNVGTSQDAAILIRLEGSSSALTNVFQFAGTAAKKPGYFIATNAGGQASTFLQAKTVGGTQDVVLVCNINGSTYWIPLYAASD